MKALSLSAINTSNPCLPQTHFLKVPIFHPFFRFKPFSNSSHGAKRAHTLPLTISCKLKNSQEMKNKGKSVSQKIVLSEASPPPLTEDDKNNGDSKDVPESSKKKGGLSGVANMLRRKTLQILSNLPLAIGEMFAVASLMALGICSSFLLFSLLIWTSHMFYLFVVLKKNYGLRRMVVGWHF